MLALIHIQWIVGIIFIILYCVTILGLVLVIITENRNPLKTRVTPNPEVASLSP
jgi:cardiolipin synthase